MKGFSLIEILIYCAIVSIIMVSFYSSIFILSSEKSEILSLIQSEGQGQYILERLTEFVNKNEIENAKKYLSSFGLLGIVDDYMGTKQFKTTFTLDKNEFKFTKNLP